jgi:hypothetical protein
MAELPGEPGWYRLTGHGWDRVPDEVALAESAAMAPGYQDLLYVEYTEPAAAAEVPLF